MKTPNYARGKIYKIICNDPELIYYGSTTRSLRKRFKNHKYNAKSKKYSSYKLFEAGGAKIKLVEKYPCKSKKELEEREGEYILCNPCVNIYLPGTWKKVKVLKDIKNGDQAFESNQESEPEEEMESCLLSRREGEDD